jgi:hypothetical protein
MIRQILDATQEHGDAEFLIDGSDPTQVRLVCSYNMHNSRGNLICSWDWNAPAHIRRSSRQRRRWCHKYQLQGDRWNR